MDSSDESYDSTPPEIKLEANAVLQDLLPPKSKEKYILAYEKFLDWKRERKSKSLSENVFLAYFSDLAKKMKPTSLWNTYSMLKSTILVKHNINIKDYHNLTSMLKRQSDGYKCKKSKVLTGQNIEKFLNEAPDCDYLAAKLSASDAKQVRIVGLHRRLSGLYQCEVSADAPLFHTDIRSAPLTIVDPPFRAPRLWVSRATFSRGDVVRAHCSVDDAYPAPNITWILDGYKIGEHVSDPPPEFEFKERGANSSLELTLGAPTADPMLLDYTYQRPEPNLRDPIRYSVPPPASGVVTISCVAVIHDVYARGSEPVTLREDTPRPASVTTDENGSWSRRGGVLAVLCAALCVTRAL